MVSLSSGGFISRQFGPYINLTSTLNGFASLSIMHSLIRVWWATAKLWSIVAGLWILIAHTACTPEENQEEKAKQDSFLFTTLSSSETGIDFSNQLSYDQDFNIYTYRNFYNGGGVALGDINGDNLLDIYLTSNMQPNRLYIAKGDLQYEDITEKAMVGGTRAWSTGVSMADVNGDGLLDIYVCNSGDVEGDNKQNELFINQGNLVFSEQAEAYGLADRGFSTHAAFFDYDRDGDLDLYLLNNSYKAIGSFNLRKNERPKRDPVGGDKLFRNDGERFTDVSEEAGIYGSVIGFGLGVTVGDINLDGWQDIYVCNDFFERDYIYLNNQDGTFSERLTDQMRSISGASMGADMADINNDGYPDIFVTEMLPEPNDRVKTVTTFENWYRYQYNLSNGYYHQFTRNMLHLNNGISSKNGIGSSKLAFFSEIGRLAGIEATDWSWGALITDLDNDGLKDIYVANGIYQDLTDQDFINFISNEETMKSIISKEGVNFQKLIDAIPVNRISNYAFANLNGHVFADSTKFWGLSEPSHSNGAAYGDLDNDGDLDLIVNNVNMPLFVYRNNLEKRGIGHNFLQFQLLGEGMNTAAFGTSITAFAEGKTFFVEQLPMRGFQSSVDPRPHIGLGTINLLDSIKVKWPDGRLTVLSQVPANQVLTLQQNKAKQSDSQAGGANPSLLFTNVTNELGWGYQHKENAFVDFDRDRLLFHMLSTQGPHLAKADVNGDGLEDFFIGGAKDSPGTLFLQTDKGGFQESSQEAFLLDKISEDVDAAFFDADQDGDMDLYVASGGNELPTTFSALGDRLYFNDGAGNFERDQQQILPNNRYESTACVRPADFDGDGDTDLFVGSRLEPFQYGVPVNSYLLENDGNGKFTNVTGAVAPFLERLGMVTDAVWTDINADELPDLLIIGEWMEITMLLNQRGSFDNMTEAVGLAKSNGWWNRIVPTDIDADGNIDFILGNHGLNSRFNASHQKPVSMYVGDFDRNGSVEQMICTYNGEKSYPLVLRHDLIEQLPYLKKKYLQYKSYRDQTINDIFDPQELERAIKLEAYHLENALLRNLGNGRFKLEPLPWQAQTSPILAVLTEDLDNDGHQDLLLAGNFLEAKPEVGRYDASYGTFLKGDGQGNLVPTNNSQTGLFLDGQVRDLQMIKTINGPLVLVALNNAPLQVLKVNKRFGVNLP